ncbi:nucleotidyl transferase AbiEii/AbiGii toxin family protein [Sulfurospirillum barnesii]|uniref:Nucleotidyl transferase AbiEii toxin, Type IV TA system n=1 Tax=Sulfurospirillum barnesii (strain ATCC 700032 / DSM 10660 / SES-3) TaxID=760154 RepID=I3XVY1_SULBS|nr:nucleotidyl transferase AbiEii/AbiGii toxin family protein [Sulfurospirillum barnesii]AFL68105.1 protein of unknown function (DUF1814) [Sulfurospirillum barnesii SES-3]
MYDFSKQAHMLGLTLDALKSIGIDKEASLGGGTALSAYYWEHRYSTDIDIFINNANTLNDIRTYFASLHVNYDIRFPGHYVEIHLSSTEKIQFFETSPRTKAPCVCTELWGFQNIYIESVEEILAKKIRFRGEKGNTRDIFDIALGISKHPSFIEEALRCEAFSYDHLDGFKKALKSIVSSKDLMQIYEMEIAFINPAPLYQNLAFTAPKMLLEKLS